MWLAVTHWTTKQCALFLQFPCATLDCHSIERSSMLIILYTVMIATAALSPEHLFRCDVHIAEVCTMHLVNKLLWKSSPVTLLNMQRRKPDIANTKVNGWTNTLRLPSAAPQPGQFSTCVKTTLYNENRLKIFRPRYVCERS